MRGLKKRSIVAEMFRVGGRAGQHLPCSWSIWASISVPVLLLHSLEECLVPADIGPTWSWLCFGPFGHCQSFCFRAGKVQNRTVVGVGKTSLGTRSLQGPLRFALFTQSRGSSFWPDCYGARHPRVLLCAILWATLLERSDNLIYVSLPFQMSTVGCSPSGSSYTTSSLATPSQTWMQWSHPMS